MNFLIDRITARKRNEFATKVETYGAIHGAKIKLPRISVAVDNEVKAKTKEQVSVDDGVAKSLLEQALANKAKEKARV